MDAKTINEKTVFLSNVSFTVSVVLKTRSSIKTNFRKLIIFRLLINGLLDRYRYRKEILGFDRKVLAHLFTIPAFFLITFYSFFLLLALRAFLVRPASEKKRLKL